MASTTMSIQTPRSLRRALTIPSYRLDRCLGKGGMGHVYEGVRLSDGLRVAVKVAHHGSASGVAALDREVRVLSGLRHPGVVCLLDHGVANGTSWFAMELYRRGSLQRYAERLWSRHRGMSVDTLKTDALLTLARTPVGRSHDACPMETPRELPPAAAGRLGALGTLFRNLCAVVFDVHCRGCVHGDLKPANIVLGAAGPVLIDFGQSRVDGEGLVMRPSGGTVEYCAPELVAGALASPASDVYALGCIFYELLTGRRAFAGHPDSVLLQQLSGVPLPASRWVRGVSPALQGALSAVLSKDAAARAPALRALLDRLP